MICDLHAHSYYSDGELAPTDLVALAEQRGVEVLALTDHDSVDGIPEAQAAARDSRVRLIVGTEISAMWFNHDIHIVGLNIDPEHPILIDGLKRHQAMREQRAQKMGELFIKQGIPGAYEAARDYAQQGLIARPHFARFLVEQGHVKDMGTAFRKFLRRGKPCYVPTQWCSVTDVVDWIKQAGGIAVLAHPARYKLTKTQLQHLLRDFVGAGGQGIEVAASSHTAQDVLTMARYSKEYELLASQGSDYHGPSSHAQLGLMPQLPNDCQPIWRAFL